MSDAVVSTHARFDGMTGVSAAAARGASTAPRLRALDGLRGWTALSVLLFHVFWETFGARFPAFRNIFVAGLLNGGLDVSIFFVVSGAALSAPFFAGGGVSYVLSSAVKRYVRLTTPIAAAVATMWLVSLTGLVRSHEAAAVLGREDWLGLMAPTQITLSQAISWAFVDVYANPAINGPILPFLWTMPIEMTGSIILFAVLACYSVCVRPERLLALAAACLLPIFPYLSAFLFGALLAQARVGGADNILSRAAAMLSGLPARIAGALAAYAASAFMLTQGGLPIFKVLLAVFCVLLVFASPRARGFFGEHPLSRFLGEISFPLYLVHYIVIVAVAAPLVVWMRDGLTIVTAASIALLTVILSIGAATLFVPVEQFAHRLGRRFAKAILA